MAEYIIQEETLIDIADAIREKEGGSEVGPVSITWDGDTTGKLCITQEAQGSVFVVCQVTDRIFTEEEIKAGSIVRLGETHDIGASWDAGIDSGLFSVGDGYYNIFGLLFTTKSNVSVSGLSFPEPGVWFPSVDGTVMVTSFTTVAALDKALIPVLEFKPRILALSGGEQATPEISVDESGLITATAGDKSATKQLSTQSGKTITPGPTEQIAVAAGKYVTGDIIIEAIQNTGGGDGSAYVVNIPVNISAEVSVAAERYYPYALFNDVRLPRIPDALMKNYAYLFIRTSTTVSGYDLVAANDKWYKKSSDGKLYKATSAYVWYTVTTTATAWSKHLSLNDGGPFGKPSDLLWANFDVPNGSADGTTFCFTGSDPVPTD